MQAVLDWSHDLLSANERAVLERISVFRGSFTLESAVSIASDDALAPADAFESVSGLVAKSLVSVDTSGDRAYFRLLETTRDYASNRLAGTGQAVLTRRRHAVHLHELLLEAEDEWHHAVASVWRCRHGRYVDDVRAALDWALSPEGNIELGIAITVRSALLLFEVARVEESVRYVETAVQALRSSSADPNLEFDLKIVHGLGLHYTHGIPAATQRAFERALAIARERSDSRQLALAVSVNWLSAYVRGEPGEMLDLSKQYEAVTTGNEDPAATVMHERMQVATLHLLGNQRGAALCAERCLAAPNAARPAFFSGAHIDHQIAVETILARVLWLQGLSDQAEAMAAQALERAVRDGQTVSLAYVLAWAACPIALWTGSEDLARDRIALLARLTREHALVIWRGHGLAFESLQAWRDGGHAGEPVLPHGIDRRILCLGDVLATLHPALAGDESFSRGDSGQAGWCQAELLRVRGEFASDADPEAAEALFWRSLQQARRDGTLSWELRTSTSLGRLWMAQGRWHAALELLDAMVCRIKEGHSTRDVREALELRDVLQDVIAASSRASVAA